MDSRSLSLSHTDSQQIGRRLWFLYASMLFNTHYLQHSDAISSVRQLVRPLRLTQMRLPLEFGGRVVCRISSVVSELVS